MSLRILSSSLITAVLLSVAFNSVCFADDDFPAPTAAPSGQAAESSPIQPTIITTQTQGGKSFRIKRDYQPRLYGTIQTNKVVPNLPYVPSTPSADGLVQANDYAGGASQAAFVPQKPKAPVQSTYVWFQSAEHGYYDGSGQYKDLVDGDKLYSVGGHFADGSPVPTTPVVCNFKGHTYKPYIVKRVP
ncbi:MAG: hypothetical protein K2X81_23025 [Candidatus Obscuribacterales bacterium]|nr:hypothetical protein [Candidatus Obscuribacterales bacterium]